MTDLAGDTCLEVVRWRRFGHDRLYVNGPDGTRIGWLDMKTGEATLEIEDRRAAFEIAIAHHVAADAPPADEPEEVANVTSETTKDVELEVDGFRQPYVRNARYEADRAERILTDAAGFPVPVVGLIAIICPKDQLTLKKQPADGRVVVVPRKQLAAWLERRGPILDSEHIDAIFEVARRSTTWV